MNKRIQKLLSVLAAVLLLVSSLPVTALAVSGSTDITATVEHERTMTILPHPGGELLYVAPLKLYAGDAVEFTPAPDEGYTLKSIVWYTTDAANATDITAAKKFTMPDADVTVKVEFAALCTVSFDMQGHGSAISPIMGVVAGSVITAPTPEPTASGYTFGGWYADEDCKQAWNFEQDTVKGDMTLYAKWIQNSTPKAAISGNVTEQNYGNVPGATVELCQGTNKLAATVTDESGNYSFGNVENGTYDIVVTKEDGKTKTEMVTVNTTGGYSVNVELPASDVSSIVEHNGTEIADAKSDISQTVVGGLDKIAANQNPNDNDKITIKLTVEPKADADTAEQKKIKNEAGNGKKVEFLDLSLSKQVNDDEPEDIGGDNTQLLTIVVPFDFTGMDVSGVMILRNHGGNTEKLKKNPASGQEGFVVDEQAGTLTIFAMKFSEYAIAYDETGSEPEQPERPVRPGGGGGRTPVSDDTMPFVDVAKNAYYYDAVKWAAKNDITSGTDATHFSPDVGTTRAQVVTFLWRMAGCPEPKGNASKFVDVERGSYYEKAVAWAIEQGITKGTSATTFSPDVVCTRAQIVTFLARFAGVADEATGYKHGFTDVNAADYFNNAVAWAKDNKVTEGTSATTFSPHVDCTRAQVATFLYRWMVK